jgi:hypothetical protein
MAKKKEDEVAATEGVAETENTEKALTVKGESDILALSSEGGGMQQVVAENFGATGLTLADLDKIKLPSQGATKWEVPTVLEGEDDTRKELTGVIIGWADKKSWWVKSFAESGGKEQPDCKSNDMVHGVGNPMAFYNDKEATLMDTGKIGAPVRAAAGFLCSTCPHNQFGSAANGGGKSCQDKRFLVMLLTDSVIPVLIRAPATSIMPLKQYFKRLAGGRRSYLSVLTSLSLIKVDAKIAYSQIVPKAVRYLTPEEEAQVRELRAPFQQALDADDAVEQGYTEKNVAEETLADMPSQTDEAAPATPATAEPSGNPDTAPSGSSQAPF